LHLLPHNREAFGSKPDRKTMSTQQTGSSSQHISWRRNDVGRAKLEAILEGSKPSALRSGPLTLAERIEQMEGALTANQMAKVLNVSEITIYKQAKAGRIPSFRVGACVRFDPKTVAKWLRTQ
jgi:excisionase family DNA binding protein